MLLWITANLGNIAVCTVLIVIVAAIIRGQLPSKKKGKSSCSCGCAGCSMAGKCCTKN